MSERGVYGVDRGIWDHPAFKPERFTHREGWLWLLSEAAWKAHSRWVGSVQVDLARGQLAHSLRFMASKWRWSEAGVRRFLKRLQSRAMIVVTTDAGVTVITICNYAKYQRVSLPRDAVSDAAPTQRRRKEENKECKEYKIDDDGSGAKREKAFAIANEIGKLCGYPTHYDWPPAFCGGPSRVEMWLDRGWPEEMIMLGVRQALARKRDGPPSTVKYFEKPIAHAVALALAPLPDVKIIEGETIEVTRNARANPSNGNVVDAAKRIARRLEEFTRPPAIRSGQSGAIVQLLPEGKRE